METQSRTRYLFPGKHYVFYSYILVAKGKEMFGAGIGAKPPTYGQNVLYGGTEQYNLAPYFCSYRIIR
jgi:hypothetical protein